MSDYQKLNLKLGRKTEEASLDPIPRALARARFGELPFQGFDLWNAYEVSFLLPCGKPVVYHMQVVYPANSPNIVESKSFKLYLNSWNNRTFPHLSSFQSQLEKDLKQAVGTAVELLFYEPERSPARSLLPGFCVDHLALDSPNPAQPEAVLRLQAKGGHFAFSSHLLRSRCPVTNQPDWGSVSIKGIANKVLEPGSLLTYLVSCRERQDFHEACCETLFMDLYHLMQPERLRVTCYYTRRGGLDINPMRTNEPDLKPRFDLIWRQ